MYFLPAMLLTVGITSPDIIFDLNTGHDPTSGASAVIELASLIDSDETY